MYDEHRMSPALDGSSLTLLSCSDEGKVFSEPNTGIQKVSIKKKKEKDKKAGNSKNRKYHGDTELDSPVQLERTKRKKGDGTRRSSLDLTDLRSSLKGSKQSHPKKKVSPKEGNVSHASCPELTKDFKPKLSKSDEAKEFIKKALRKNFVFADLTSKDLKPLVSAFESCSFEPEQIIIKQGDQGDYFYIIQKGSVTFRVNGVDVGKAGKGSSFGELAFLLNCPRGATVVTTKKTKVFRVGQATFQLILQNKACQSAKEKFQLLRDVNFFKDLDMKNSKTLVRAMTPKVFREGDFLVRKGDGGNAFYVIQEGEVVVKDISVGSTTYGDLRLGPGGYFSERALIASEPRAANVVALTGGVAFSIDWSTLRKVLEGMESVKARAGDARLLWSISLFREAFFLDDVYVRLAELIKETCYEKGQIIMTKGHQIEPALFVIRKGQVLVRERAGVSVNFLSTGGLFGQETMLDSAEAGLPCIDAPYSVAASTDCILGVLTLRDCKQILDNNSIKRKKTVPSFALYRKEPWKKLPRASKADIKLADLKKKLILGTGNFGQVWLVQGTDRLTGTTKPYALKLQTKYGLHEEGQITSVIREKQILSKLSHPFIVNLVATYQDPTFVYFLTEFVQGGELFSRIHREDGSGMKEQEAKFYALGIADALGYMHSMKVVYRDIKPENILIDAGGFPKLVDFGAAKYCPDKTYTFCGTPGYVAPEIITKKGHNFNADNWSLGVLLYEMLSGENPFYYEGLSQAVLFQSIVEDDFVPLSVVSKEAADVLSGLLAKDPLLRLGCSSAVTDHPWFADLKLDAMRQRILQPPWKPNCNNPYDANNFDDWSGLEDKFNDSFVPLPPDVQKQFQEEF